MYIKRKTSEIILHVGRVTSLSDIIYGIKLASLDSKIPYVLSYFDEEFALSKVCSHAKISHFKLVQERSCTLLVRPRLYDAIHRLRFYSKSLTCENRPDKSYRLKPA